MKVKTTIFVFCFLTAVCSVADSKKPNILFILTEDPRITGQTLGNFLTTTGAFQTTYCGTSDVYVAKLNASGTALVYCTYRGGSGGELGNGIAVDGSGNAHVAGRTGGSFPTTAGAAQTTYGGATLMSSLPNCV